MAEDSLADRATRALYGHIIAPGAVNAQVVDALARRGAQLSAPVRAQHRVLAADSIELALRCGDLASAEVLSEAVLLQAEKLPLGKAATAQLRVASDTSDAATFEDAKRGLEGLMHAFGDQSVDQAAHSAESAGRAAALLRANEHINRFRATQAACAPTCVADMRGLQGHLEQAWAAAALGKILRFVNTDAEQRTLQTQLEQAIAKLQPKKEESSFKCPGHCERTFTRRHHLNRHVDSALGIRDRICLFRVDDTFCGQRFGRKDHLRQHQRRVHPSEAGGPPRRRRRGSTRTQPTGEFREILPKSPSMQGGQQNRSISG